MSVSKSSGSGLERSITMWGVALLVISSMIGSGVFKKVSGMSLSLGSPGLVLACWAVAGLITLMGSLSNAEVASMFPEAGGQYVYFKHIFGRFFAYLYGWTTFSVVQSATIASVGFVFAESFVSLVHLPDISASLPEGLRTWGSGLDESFTPFSNLTVKLITIFMIWAMVLINILGIKMGKIISTLLATTIVISITVIIVMCFGFSGGSAENLTNVPDGPHYYDMVHRAGEGVGGLHLPEADKAMSGPALEAHAADDIPPIGLFGAFFAAMLAAFWAYEGWITIGYVGGEVKDGNRNLPRGLMWGALIVTIVYCLVHVSYLYARPVEWFADLAGRANTIAAVELLRDFLGYGGAMFLSLLILCSTFNATNTSILAAPRVYYALAKDGLFFKSAAEVHPKFHTPHKALIIQGFWASMLCLSGSFDMLTDMLIFAAFIFYGAGAWGVIVLRNKMPDAPRPFKVPLYPFVPAIFTIFSAVLVVRTIWDQPALAAKGLLLILIGVPLYFYWDRKNRAA
jgi:basic amino acid/polyamine antiporter, APA family